MHSENLKKILLGAEAYSKDKQRILRLERLIGKKGGEFPAHQRGTLAYHDSLRELHTFLLRLKHKGFNADTDTLCRWVRVRGGIYYRKGCAYHGELRALIDEPGGFGLLRPKGEHIDNLARYAVEEAGFYVPDYDVNHFLDLILQDLRDKDVFSMWKEADIGGLQRREHNGTDGGSVGGASLNQDGTGEDPF